MKRILFFGLTITLSIFVSCSDKTPTLPNETIDEAILGAWQVDFSQTIRGVRMRDAEGTLEIVPGLPNDTTIFLGEPETDITSFMFGRNENIIEIRNDNTIRIYRINSRGGVTITDDRVRYFVRGDTLFRQVSDTERLHLFHLENDTLTIRRVPIDPDWIFTISRYFRTSF